MEGLEMPGDKKREGMLDRAAELFDLPAEALAGAPRLTITGNRRIVVENHKGLLEYGENEIDVNVGRTILKIKGEDLELRAMNADELMVTGTVFGIEFVY